MSVQFTVAVIFCGRNWSVREVCDESGPIGDYCLFNFSTQKEQYFRLLEHFQLGTSFQVPGWS